MRIVLTEFCLILIGIGLHTGISIAPGGRLVAPFAMAGIGAAGTIVLNLDLLTAKLVKTYGILFISVGGLAVATAAANGDLVQHCTSSAVFCYSVTIACGSAVGVASMGWKRAASLFMMGTVILIVGCCLELYGGLRPLSDSFRAMVNNWRASYSAPVRDMTDYGGLRPNFFASEPSVVGIMTGYSILFWFLAARRYTVWRLAMSIVLYAGAFAVIRSPTILVSCAAGVIFFASEIGLWEPARRGRVVVLCALCVGVILALPPLMATWSSYARSGSFFQRELGPPIVALTVLKEHPFWGVGLGGYHAIAQTILNVYSNAGAFSRFSYIYTAAIAGLMDPKHMMANQFWELWIYFGLCGGAWIIILIGKILAELGSPNVPLVLCAGAMLLTTSGGIGDPIGWTGIFVAASLYSAHCRALRTEESRDILGDTGSHVQKLSEGVAAQSLGLWSQSDETGTFTQKTNG